MFSSSVNELKVYELTQSLLENILQLIRNETKRNYKIILTGGFSSLFKNSIKSKVFIDKDITMKGLIEILKVK